MKCGTCDHDIEPEKAVALITTPPIFGYDRIDKWHDIKKFYVCSPCWDVIKELLTIDREG